MPSSSGFQHGFARLGLWSHDLSVCDAPPRSLSSPRRARGSWSFRRSSSSAGCSSGFSGPGVWPAGLGGGESTSSASRCGKSGHGSGGMRLVRSDLASPAVPVQAGLVRDTLLRWTPRQSTFNTPRIHFWSCPGRGDASSSGSGVGEGGAGLSRAALRCGDGDGGGGGSGDSGQPERGESAAEDPPVTRPLREGRCSGIGK